MTNTFKKSLLFTFTCLLAATVWAVDVTFTMSSIFDGTNLSMNVTTPVAATVSTNASKSNAKEGKLGSDGHYFQIVLQSNTFTAASINGFINTTSTDKNWAFQFSTDGGNSWSEEKTQPNDGTKSAHDIAVNVNVPSGANGFRVIRRAGTSTVVSSITLTLGSGGGDDPTPGGGDDPTPGGGDDPTPGGGDDPTPGGGDDPTPGGGDTPTPSAALTTHTPEIYEDPAGYNTPLVDFNNREYEVYYMTRDADSKFCIATTNADKTTGITTRGSNDYACTATDGWFKFSGTGWSSSSDAMGDEFGTMARRLDMDNSCEFTMHIKGFDQFALVARDKKKDTSSGQTKPGDNKYLEVYIDDVLQPLQFDASPSIRRYDVSVAEHVVRVKHFGGDKSAMYAFSLRVSDNPRTKYLKGNDTTQVILQTQAPLPVYYTTKNFSKGMPEILWDGNAAEGISLTSKAHDNLRDTSFISGVANCPIGEYKYYVITKANGVETSRSKQGKFSVIRKMEFQNKRDSAITIYQETALTPIVINYYSTDDDALTWEWIGTPNSYIQFTKDADANTLTISGTPQKEGTFQYTVHLTDAEDIHGQITVRSNKPTDIGADKTMLYLSKTDDLPSNGIFNELKGKYNYFPRAAAAGIAQTYEGYDFILISENVDADNEEALALIRGEIDKPVLNMKAFTYAPERVSKEGWGEPDNGTLNENDGLYITIQRDDHPIFRALNKKQGDKIKVLSQIDQKGLMPININHCNGSLALATAYPRDINDYYESAEYQQTILHEIPAGSSLRKGNSKYICMPIAMSSSNYITPEAKQLLAQVIDYLTSSESSTVSVPELKITSFSIDGVAAQIGNDTILLEIDTTAHSVDLSKAIPAITVASPYTHTEPMAGEEVNFVNSAWVPVVYTVTDYINRRTYDVIVRAYNPQGIDEVYTAGEWVNIYDVFGRMITTTNQDIYTMDLPRGMYIVVTANGETIKIMR